MRRFSTLAALAVLAISTSSGFLKIENPDSFVRMERCLIETENPRETSDEWRRGGWIQDQPTHLTPYRIHGGVGPVSSSI
jgi:hypothetical protein